MELHQIIVNFLSLISFLCVVSSTVCHNYLKIINVLTETIHNRSMFFPFFLSQKGQDRAERPRFVKPVFYNSVQDVA